MVGDKRGFQKEKKDWKNFGSLLGVNEGRSIKERRRRPRSQFREKFQGGGSWKLRRRDHFQKGRAQIRVGAPLAITDLELRGAIHF